MEDGARVEAVHSPGGLRLLRIPQGALLYRAEPERRGAVGATGATAFPEDRGTFFALTREALASYTRRGNAFIHEWRVSRAGVAVLDLTDVATRAALCAAAPPLDAAEARALDRSFPLSPRGDRASRESEEDTADSDHAALAAVRRRAAALQLVAGTDVAIGGYGNERQAADGDTMAFHAEVALNPEALAALVLAGVERDASIPPRTPARKRARLSAGSDTAADADADEDDDEEVAAWRRAYVPRSAINLDDV